MVHRLFVNCDHAMQVGFVAQEAHPAEVVLCRFCAAGSDPLPHSSHRWDGQGE